MRFPTSPLAAIVAIGLLSGCSAQAAPEESPSTSESEATEAPAAEPTGFDLANIDAADLDTAMSALVQEVGEDPAQITDFNLSSSTVMIYAVDPAAPEELNSWEYRNGAVGASTPVDYGGDVEALQQNLFSTADLSSTAIASALAEAPAATEIEDGEVDGATAVRMGPEFDVILQVSVTGERDSKLVRFDLDGNLLEVI